MDTELIKKPIVLIGVMGAGKTTIGMKLAQKLQLPFIDTDAEVAKKAGCSIADIFKYQGEEYFIKLETQLIKEWLNKVVILSTGGKSFAIEENRKLIKEYSISVWLKVEFDILYERVSRKKTRPLLERGNKAVILKELIEELYPIYAEADITITSSDMSHNVIVDTIIEELASICTSIPR
ncbi:Shikimate kinase 1 [Rickettsiales bacterium Ac37b]|nr:Shikimate kinase 1 [Rickettsiales bacterium Ac37b]